MPHAMTPTPIEAAIAALEPFAAWSEMYGDHVPDSGLIFMAQSIKLIIGDLRRARRCLDQLKAEAAPVCWRTVEADGEWVFFTNYDLACGYAVSIGCEPEPLFASSASVHAYLEAHSLKAEAASPRVDVASVDVAELSTLYEKIPQGPFLVIRSSDGHEIRQIDTDPQNKHHWPFRLLRSIPGQIAGCDDAVFDFVAGVVNAWREIAAALASDPRPAQDVPDEWRPIETAPVGEDVLLYCPHRHFTNPARIELGMADNGSGSHHSWATHWMPLPAAPKQGTDR